MDEYKVKLLPRAFRDLESIYEYISAEKQSPETAKGQTDRIQKAIKGLSVMPFAHQERLVGRYANHGYRQLLVDNYIAIFRIDEKKKTVYVVTIQYSGRNF